MKNISTFQFVLVDGGVMDEPKKTFKSLEEIDDYVKNKDLKGDILKLVEPRKGFNPNNVVLYTHHYWNRSNLKEKFQNGEVDMEYYNNELQEIIQEEKEETKAFKELKK